MDTFCIKENIKLNYRHYAELEREKKWEDIIEPVKSSFVDGTFPPGKWKISHQYNEYTSDLW